MTPLPQTLPDVKRFITTHDNKGAAIFSTAVSEAVPQTSVPGAYFSLVYATNSLPISLQKDADLSIYGNYLEENPGLAISTGSVCRVVDIGPGVTSDKCNAPHRVSRLRGCS
jgi:hypothetical protein